MELHKAVSSRHFYLKILFYFIKWDVIINDIPTPRDPATKSSIFADDSSAWRSGKNIGLLSREIQKHLDKVSSWADKWGFKLSETKTTAVLFTNSLKIDLSSIKLSIKGINIKLANEAKFLGVTFDRRLTWGIHITNVETKCKKTINLMRSVSGNKWGASKKALLIIYRTLIRSRLDYGCEAYYTASKIHLAKLDQIQSACLRICCGAFKGTATSALQQDCGEMSLCLRRKRNITHSLLK